MQNAKAKDAASRPQEKVDAESVTKELINISQAMSDKTFVAKINDRCRSCGVKASCPIQPQGQAVIGK